MLGAYCLCISHIHFMQKTCSCMYACHKYVVGCKYDSGSFPMQALMVAKWITNESRASPKIFRIICKSLSFYMVSAFNWLWSEACTWLSANQQEEIQKTSLRSRRTSLVWNTRHGRQCEFVHTCTLTCGCNQVLPLYVDVYRRIHSTSRNGIFKHLFACRRRYRMPCFFTWKTYSIFGQPAQNHAFVHLIAGHSFRGA